MVRLPGANLPRVGELVGPFRIEHELARGGLGAVFAATGARGERVALKVLLAPERGDGRERFRREAQVGMTLRHPGLCPVLQFGEHKGLAYLTMPLLEGAVSLTEFAEGLTPRARVELMIQVADALAALHAAESLHRDLKPSNVLVTPDGAAKIVDFGLVKPLERSALTEPGQVMGTPHYMSPELVRGGAAQVDQRSDLFSFGVLLHEVISGERPFVGETPVSVMRGIVSGRPAPLEPHLDPALGSLADVVRVCLAKDPRQRYAGAADLAADLRAVLAGEPLSPLARRRGGRRLLAVMTALALVLGLGLAMHLGGRGPAPQEAEARAARLAQEAERWLRRREAPTPPPEEWAQDVARLERGAPSEQARSARVRVRVALGLYGLSQGEQSAAKAHLDALSGEKDPLVRVLRGAWVEAEGGEASVALANLVGAEAQGVRSPEVRGWRARARVRAAGSGLSRDDASAALRDLEALAQVRALHPPEERARGRALLALGKVEQAAEVLARGGDLPGELEVALVLALVAMDLRHSAPAAAAAKLQGVELTGALEQREALSEGCVRRAQSTSALLASGGVSEAEKVRMLEELKVARLLRGDVPLPKGLVHDLLAVGRDAQQPDFAVAVSLVDLAPDDVEVQRAIGLLAVYANSMEDVYRSRFLVAARRALDRLPLGDDWEEVAVARVRGLTFEGRYVDAVKEAREVLPKAKGRIARIQLSADLIVSLLNLDRFVEAKAAAERGLEEEPKHFTFNYYRARALIGLQREDEIYGDALAFAGSGFDSGTGRQHRALAWAWGLRDPRALAELRPAFESFLRENALHPGWFVRAAVVQLDAGDVPAALDSLEAAARGFAEGSGEAPTRFAEPAQRLADRLRADSADPGVRAGLDAMTAELDRLRGDESVP